MEPSSAEDGDSAFSLFRGFSDKASMEPSSAEDGDQLKLQQLNRPLAGFNGAVLS